MTDLIPLAEQIAPVDPEIRAFPQPLDAAAIVEGAGDE